MAPDRLSHSQSPPTRYDEHAGARRVAEASKVARSERTPYQRDRARVLHSAALRRLAAKTQVLGIGEDDFPRTRLTHSLECAQVGRELAAAIGADPDVVDAACLAHDLGHPPFGHNGELALDLAAAGCGGFEGNAQSLRVLTRLEAKVADESGRSAGLNLTRAVLDAATKYPWPKRSADEVKYGVYADDLPAFEWVRDGAPDPAARCIEAQVMDWADDVAYSVHDLEDGIHAGSVSVGRIDVDAVTERAARDYCDASPVVLAKVFAQLRDREWWLTSYDGSWRAQAALKRMTSELIGRFTAAALAATRQAHGRGPLVRYGADFVVPDQTRQECALLKAVTAHYVMGPRAQMQGEERDLVIELVDALARRAPDALEPGLRDEWRSAPDDAARLRVVIDQVASLTDTSARAWHARLAGP